MSDELFRREFQGEWKVADPVKVAVESHPLPWRTKEHRTHSRVTGEREHAWIILDANDKAVAELDGATWYAAALICDAVNRYPEALAAIQSETP